MTERRRRNSGSIREKGGKFEARFWVSKTKQKSKTFTKRANAVAWLTEEQSKAERRRVGIEKVVEDHRSFGELCDKWIKERAKAKAENSQDTDASFIKCHLRPRFGDLELRNITTPKIDRFKSDQLLVRKLHKNTINHHLVLLGSMLRYAIELEWLRLDQLPEIRKYKIPTPDFDYLKNNTEISRVLQSAAVDKYKPAITIYATLIYTGMRVGELCGLKWSDVDFTARIITVQRSYDQPTTKGAELRRVPILAPLLPVLERWKLKASSRDLVFTSRAGTMLRKDSRVFDEVLKRVLVRAGFPDDYVSIHDTRHSFASHWLLNGGDRFRLQRILGHKDPKTTERYAHLHPDAFAEDAHRIPNLIPGTVADVIPLLAR